MIRSAVVGVGYLGRFHAQKHKTLGTLKFICDASESRLREVATELSCDWILDPKELIGKVDAVTIAADTKSHFELCRLFLSQGVHVFVEKPICTTVREAEEIVNLADKKGLTLAVGHIERFNPSFVEGLKHAHQPSYLQLQRLAPFKPRSLSVDVVLDLMIHDLDLATTLTKSSVRNIRAKGARVITSFNDACDAWVEFENGSEAFISCSRVDQRTLRAVQVFDSRGILSMDLGAQKVQRLCHAVGDATAPLQIQSFAVQTWDAMQKETEDFFGAIAEKRRPVVTGHQGLEALRNAEKILELTR